MKKLLLTLLAAATLVTVGCSSDDDDGGSTTTAGSGETTTSTAGDMGAGPASLDVTAVDFGYELADGAPLPAGAITIDLTNDGAEEHQATVVQFKDGKSPADLAAIGDDPTQLYDTLATFGGPNSAFPGGSTSATVDLEAGSYTLICFIPSPDDGIAHAAKGMLTTFEVAEAEGEGAALPETTESVVLSDFMFTVPDGFTGAGEVEVVNAGPQSHELVAYQLDEGKTIDDAMAFLAVPPGGEPPEGPPPFVGGTGIGALDPGRTNTVTLDLAPGDHVLICFLPDVDSGLPHFLAGMAQPLTIG